MKYDFAPACALVQASQNIFIAGHVSPDGDTLEIGRASCRERV